MPHLIIHETHYKDLLIRSRFPFMMWMPELLFNLFVAFDEDMFLADFINDDANFPSDWTSARRRDCLTRMLARPIQVNERLISIERIAPDPVNNGAKTIVLRWRPGALPAGDETRAWAPGSLSEEDQGLPLTSQVAEVLTRLIRIEDRLDRIAFFFGSD